MEQLKRRTPQASFVDLFVQVYNFEFPPSPTRELPPNREVASGSELLYRGRTWVKLTGWGGAGLGARPPFSVGDYLFGGSQLREQKCFPDETYHFPKNGSYVQTLYLYFSF